MGAHLTALRRTRVGGFGLAEARPLAELAADQPLLGLAEALSTVPALTLDAAQARDVRDGKVNVVANLAVPEGPLVRLLRPDGSLLAVAEQAEGRLRLCRVFG